MASSCITKATLFPCELSFEENAKFHTYFNLNFIHILTLETIGLEKKRHDNEDPCDN